MTKRFLLSLGWMVLALNGAYLYAFNSPTLFYIANVLFHLALGVVLLVAFGLFLRDNFLTLGPIGRIAAFTLMLGGWLGLALVYTGTTLPFSTSGRRSTAPENIQWCLLRTALSLPGFRTSDCESMGLYYSNRH